MALTTAVLSLFKCKNNLPYVKTAIDERLDPLTTCKWMDYHCVQTHSTLFYIHVFFRGWKCSRCDLKENLWLNLTDGTILCGRRYFDGNNNNNNNDNNNNNGLISVHPWHGSSPDIRVK